MNLAEALSGNVREAELWEPIDKKRIRCYACGHRCPIFEGQPGVCKVRFNKGGKLYAPWGYVANLQCDPIEKKPFFHVRPGTAAMSFGMLGCDLHCGYCQNWITSQALRDPHAVSSLIEIEPHQIVESAVAWGAESVVSTYNEPLITSEWSVAIFKEARAAGLLTGYVSNGNGTQEVLEYLRPWLDLYKIDLKSFNDHEYRKLGGRLAPILDTITRAHNMGFWVEVVTLVVPGLNDSSEELRDISAFIANVSVDIPWHVTAYHDDYKTVGRGSTPLATLRRAADIGHTAGLRYVYVGNVPAGEELESTRCAQCEEIVVRRRGYRILENRVKDPGTCPKCGGTIPGRWFPAFPSREHHEAAAPIWCG